MKLLIAIIILGNTLQITPPSATAPSTTTALGQMPFDNTNMIIGHADLAGGLFYDLQINDRVVAQYTDETSQTYTVTFSEAYAAQDSRQATVEGADFMMRVGGNWMTLTQTIDSLADDGALIFVTCYPRAGATTGRLFVQLKRTTP